MSKLLRQSVDRFLLVLIIAMSISFAGQCQQWQWANNIVSPNEFGGSITSIDNDNNVIVALPFKGQIPVGNISLTTNSSRQAIAIVKYNEQGQVVWANKFESSSSDLNLEDIHLTTDETNNVYVGGHFFQQVTIGGETLVSPDNGQNIFLCRLSENGELAWVRQIGSPSNSNEILNGLSCRHGLLFATGYFRGILYNTDDGVLATVSDADEIFLLKIDCASGGTFFQRVVGYTCSSSSLSQWYNGYTEAGNLLAIDDNDNVYISGYFSGCLNIGRIVSHITLNVGDKFSSYIAKYNDNGELLWAKSVQSPDNVFVSQLALDNSGNPYITGSYVKGISLSAALTLEENNVTPYSFLAKFSSSGDPTWLRQLSENDISPRISINDCGVFVTGTFNGSARLGGFPLGTLADIYVAKYSHDNDAIWLAYASGVNITHGSIGKGISVGNNGRVYVSGYTGSSLTFSGSAITLTGGIPSGGALVDSYFVASIQDNASLSLALSPNRTTICNGELISLKAPDGFGSYSWQKDGALLTNNLKILEVSEPGHYTVSVSSSVCGTSTASIDIAVTDLPPPPSISGNTQLCEGATTLLSAAATPYTCQWKRDGTDIPGATSYTYPAQSTGDYSLVISNDAMCTAISNTLHVDVQSVPKPNVIYEGHTFLKENGVITFCEGSTVQLFIQDRDENYSYQWYKDNVIAADANPVEWTIQRSGGYQVEIYIGSCVARSEPLTFLAVAKPVLTLDPNIKTICASGTEIGIPQESGVSYRWSDGVDSPTRIVDRPGTYSLTASRDGCSTEGTVSTIQANLLSVPNVITPGNDGKNEYFVVEGISATSELNIYNRWGRLIFHTPAYANNWNGEVLEPGTYFYVLQNADMCKNTYKGWVELIR